MWKSHTTKSYFPFALGPDFWALLWTRKKLAALLFLTIVGTGMGLLMQITPFYESSLKILVMPPTNDSSTRTAAQEMQAEIELLKSREVFTATIQELAVPEPAASESAARLSIAALDQARILQVSYRDSSPEQAARFLQTLFQKYSEYRQKLLTQTNVEAALRARSSVFNQKLDEANEALQNLETKHNLMSLSSQQDLLVKQFYETQTQLAAARTEKQALEQQIATLRAQLATQPEQVETSSVTKYAQALDKMKEELSALEMQRTQLLQKYQPQHRLIRDLEQRIVQVKELIRREEQNPPREQTIALNETRRRIANELFQAEAQLATLAPREQRLNQLAAEYQTRLGELNLQGFKKSDLERERALNEEAYLLFQKKAQEAEINAVLRPSVEIRLAEAARLNPRPISPNWPRNVMGLLLLGLVVSTGGVMAVESLSPRVRTAAGLQRRLGMKVLAKLPAAPDTKLEI
jgi:polysaccharide biosynthesis transport protein